MTRDDTVKVRRRAWITWAIGSMLGVGNAFYLMTGVLAGSIFMPILNGVALLVVASTVSGALNIIRECNFILEHNEDWEDEEESDDEED